jgi:hypothetical protein
MGERESWGGGGVLGGEIRMSGDGAEGTKMRDGIDHFGGSLSESMMECGRMGLAEKCVSSY